ncbi:hypothetical protein [Microvirga sp. VF16]|uniref:hypothetical protein n=1 Tax=Microvirga sp. VF16 TaxID=2807101 RepID=UPI00193DA4D6|nr:hypothetical protein [Microvirga sp. VF16]QRM33580.1 hypothetical protein JO965_36760 [Microvirga sp. VF16]
MTSKQGAAQRAACWDESFLSLDLYTDEIEQRIIRAYIQLMLRPDNADGSRAVMVMRLGALEVRLTELPPDSVASGIPPFWLEVFSVAGHESIDSCGCFEFDEIELASAVSLVLEAARALPLRPSVRPEPTE